MTIQLSHNRQAQVKRNALRIGKPRSSRMARWLQRQSVQARREKTIERNVEIIQMHDRGMSSYQIAERIKTRFKKELHIKARQVQNIVKNRDAVLRYWHAMLRGIRERSYQFFLRAKRGGQGKANCAAETEYTVKDCDCAKWTDYQPYNLCPVCGSPSLPEQERLDRERAWEHEYRRMAFYG